MEGGEWIICTNVLAPLHTGWITDELILYRWCFCFSPSQYTTDAHMVCVFLYVCVKSFLVSVHNQKPTFLQ